MNSDTFTQSVLDFTKEIRTDINDDKTQLTCKKYGYLSYTNTNCD